MHAEGLGFTIGGLARAAAVNVETDLGHLHVIRSAQRLGFSLVEIAELLALEDGAQRAQARQLVAQKAGS